MSERTDEQRVMAGVPVDAERGQVPGAVAKLRAELRSTAGHLQPIENRIASIEHELEAARHEQVIWRTGCDELMDAIAVLINAEIRVEAADVPK